MGTDIGKVQRRVLRAVKARGGLYANELLVGASAAQRSSTYRAISGLVRRGLVGRVE